MQRIAPFKKYRNHHLSTLFRTQGSSHELLHQTYPAPPFSKPLLTPLIKKLARRYLHLNVENREWSDKSTFHCISNNEQRTFGLLVITLFYNVLYWVSNKCKKDRGSENFLRV